MDNTQTSIALNTAENIFAESNFQHIERTPFYFGEADKQILGWLHQSEVSPTLDTCLVICPPLAVEYMSTYRSLRYLADYFALAGIPVLRFDYHGTGDSAGFNLDENRLDDWMASIENACQQAKSLTGCEKVGLFGLRIGATFAASVAAKVDVDFLILWAALENGRRYVREIKAIQMTGAVAQNPADAQLLEAGGIAYWPDTQAALSKLNLLKITPKTQATLLIPRDDFPATSKLKDSWTGDGLDVEQIELKGSADMLLNAYFTKVPHQSIEKMVNWVLDKRRPQLRTSTPPLDVHSLGPQTCHITLPKSAPSNVHENDIDLEETFFRFGPNDSRFGICTQSPEKYDPSLPKIIIANSGATHRVGPSRLHVLLARQLAGFGFQVYRIDIPGLGDSYVNERELEHDEYIESSSEEINAAITKINTLTGDNQYLVTGLCSGAYFSFRAALELPNANIIESLLINPLTFYWHKGMTFDTAPSQNFSAWNWYRQAFTSLDSWKKLFSGKANYQFLLKTLTNRIKIKLAHKTMPVRQKLMTEEDTGNINDLNRDLAKIDQHNTHMTFVLAKSDPGYDLLMTSGGKTAKKLIKQNRLKIYMIGGADHTFSKFKPRKEAITTIVKHIAEKYCQQTEE